VTSLAALLAHLRPVRQPGEFVFASVTGDELPRGLTPLATFREAEGWSVIVRHEDATPAGLAPLFLAAWITLTVPSDLQAVGLTAAVAQALTAVGISCNVVAAAHHDHLFVPVDRADEALQVLQTLSAAYRV
jgi:uncharacterized protein